MSWRGLHHGFNASFELIRVAKQVEDKRQVKIRQIYKVLPFSVECVNEIWSEEVAIEPSVVNVSCNLLWEVVCRLPPSVPLDHCHIEAIKWVKRQCWVFEAVLAVAILAKLKTNIKRLDISVDCRLRVRSIPVNVLLKFLQNWFQTSFRGCSRVWIVHFGLRRVNGLIQVGPPEMRRKAAVVLNVVFSCFGSTEQERHQCVFHILN